MPITIEDVIAIETLEEKLRTLLPEQYQDSYETLEPVPMRSAGLKYDIAGRVAWNDIWASFCDLAMAGGPPHRGSLLQAGFPKDIDRNPDAYLQVVEELCRGLAMVTGLPAQPAPARGWVQLDCTSPGMAAWLTRAIVMENIMARCDGERLYLPANPDFRLTREIKNVITSTAKTCHYWKSHTPEEQKAGIERLLTNADGPPLLEPFLFTERGDPDTAYLELIGNIGRSILNHTGLAATTHRYMGWIGIACPSVNAAIWMMRGLVADGVLARREETVLFLPVNPQTDRPGTRVVEALAQIHRFATARRVQ